MTSTCVCMHKVQCCTRSDAHDADAVREARQVCVQLQAFAWRVAVQYHLVEQRRPGPDLHVAHDWIKKRNKVFMSLLALSMHQKLFTACQMQQGMGGHCELSQKAHAMHLLWKVANGQPTRQLHQPCRYMIDSKQHNLVAMFEETFELEQHLHMRLVRT